MIELVKKELFNSNADKEIIRCYMPIDDEVTLEIRRWKDNSTEIELSEYSNFKKLLKRLGNSKLDSLISYEGEKMQVRLSLFSDELYHWEKLFFSSQAIYVENTKDIQKIYFTFFLFNESSSQWTYKYSPNYFFSEFSNINHGKVNIIDESNNNYGYQFTFELKKEFITTLSSSYNELVKAIYEIEQILYKRLASFTWKEEYHTDEPKFTKEVMIPLLKKMKYKKVRYTHGREEYGRDVIFSEINKFGEEIFYGIQVKAGDISGGANSQIDTLIAQLDDAFRMPFKLLGDDHKRYLSFFIIAISGHYKKNAKKKILEKVPQAYKPHVFFWDKDSIEDLTGTYWKAD